MRSEALGTEDDIITEMAWRQLEAKVLVAR